MTLKVHLRVSPTSHNASELKRYDKMCHDIAKSHSEIGRVNTIGSGFWNLDHERTAKIYTNATKP